MKRFLVLCAAFVLCSLAGCSSDTYEDLIKDTIEMVKVASGNVKVIKTRVDDAIKKTEGGTKKLDLSEAVDATKKLKETGDETQKIKRRIEQIRAKVTDEDRKAYAENQKQALNAAFKDLLKQKQDLQASLAAAEKLETANAKQEVKNFREKLIEAESPFEALSR